MAIPFDLANPQSPAAWPGAITPGARRAVGLGARSPCCRILVCCLVLVILGPAPSLQSAPPGNASQPAVTNAPIAEPPIPRSVFDDKLPQGKDPFFPMSTRRDAVVAPVSAAPQKPAMDLSVTNLVLKGISGSADRRLAIINNSTFAVGEDVEVNTTSGRIRIHCAEIKEKSVVIEFGDPPQRRELRLPR